LNSSHPDRAVIISEADIVPRMVTQYRWVVSLRLRL
jgi:hypothetical protein